MHIYQIPALEKSAQDFTIGVIDCSGSMEGNWKWLAEHWNRFIPLENSKIITFSTTAAIPATNRLDADIYKHGGGGTNITSGFVKLDAELKQMPPKSNITVIFISDGEDNNMGSLQARMSELEGNDGTRSINFICIGVGPGFPTFISMKLREKYHNGDETLPAIFLIEHVSEKAYTIKFEAIRPFLSVGKQRNVKPPVCVFPWREYTAKPFERAWVMTDAESIELDGEKIDMRPYYLNLRGINELFRSWNQMINLESLNEGEKVDARAKKTLALMDSILEELKEAKGIDIMLKAKDAKFPTLYEKFQFIVNKRNFERTIWYYEDVKKIAAGDTAGQLSSFEAAKRIGLGTIVGKYAQKAFALKKITPEEFENIKNEFKALLKDHKIAPKTDGHPLRKLLLEENLDKALDLIKNQLELFEAFPLHGHPARIIRNDQGQIDPQNVDLRYFSTHVNIELTDITSQQGGTLNLTIKDDKTETVNAVIPLFAQEDADLLPFINSRFYKFLLSYSLIRDADDLMDQSFSCMLSAVFGLALRSEPLDKQLIDQLITNVELIRGSVPEGDLLAAKAEDSLESLTTELNVDKNKAKAPVLKVLLNALAHLRHNRITKVTFDKVFGQTLAKIFQKPLTSNPKKINDLFASVIVKKETEEAPEVQILKQVREQFPKTRTLGSLVKVLGGEILKQTLNAEIDVTFIPGRVEKLLEDEPLSLSQLKNIIILAGEKELNPKLLERAILIASNTTGDKFDLEDETIASNAILKIKTAMKDNIKKDLEVTGKPHGKKGAKGKKGGKEAPKHSFKEMKSNPLFKSLYPQLEKEFREFFKQVHNEVIPLPKDQVEAYCKSHGINFKSIKWCANSHLPIRTCAAPKCHFYMREMSRLDNHLNIWGVKLPKGFHMLVRENRSKSVKEIYEIFEKSHYTVQDGKTVPFDPAKFDKTPEEVLQYIEKLKDAYIKIDG